MSPPSSQGHCTRAACATASNLNSPPTPSLSASSSRGPCQCPGPVTRRPLALLGRASPGPGALSSWTLPGRGTWARARVNARAGPCTP
eukprot:3917094-Rhodomonas_salina.1